MTKRWQDALAAGTVVLVLAGCKSATDNQIPESPPAQPGNSGGTGGSGSGAGGSSGSGDAERSTTAAPVPTGSRKHTVQAGDTLFKLARQYYGGDEHQWRKIYEANRDQIPDKNVLKPGQVLVIPD